MEAEADLDPRAVGPLEMEPADQAAGLLLDRDVIVTSRRRVEELGEVIRVLGGPVIERVLAAGTARAAIASASDCRMGLKENSTASAD